MRVIFVIAELKIGTAASLSTNWTTTKLNCPYLKSDVLQRDSNKSHDVDLLSEEPYALSPTSRVVDISFGLNAKRIVFELMTTTRSSGYWWPSS